MAEQKTTETKTIEPLPLERISEAFQFNKSQFEVSGVPLEEIARVADSPSFYVYDAATIKRQYEHLRNNLPSQVDIFYAAKANPHMAIIDLLVGLGTGVEVASEGELLACKLLGVNPKNIVFAGPAKTKDDLTEAIKMGIYAINVESLAEIKRISEIASSLGKTVDLELRINSKFVVDGAIVSMGGGSKKFGIDEERLEEVINGAKNLKGVNLQGIHIFSGTGILNQESFLENMKHCFEVARYVDSNYFPVLSIDVGGGLGIPYTVEQTPLSIAGIGSRIEQLIEEYGFTGPNKPRIILEPGRFLVAQSGVYVTPVEYVRESRGTKYALVEGGVHHFLRPALLDGIHPIHNLSRVSKDLFAYDVGGSLCTSVDFLGTGRLLPSSTKEGDLLGTFCAGAYGYTVSMPLFLSHGTPAEVLVSNGKAHLIREAKKAESLLADQYIPRL